MLYGCIIGCITDQFSYILFKQMSLSKLKDRLKHYKSLQNLHLLHEADNHDYKFNEYSQSNALKPSKPKREIESRLATQINQKIVTSKEELKKYAKILKINPKLKKTEKKQHTHSSVKTFHPATSTTKRTLKEKATPVLSKAFPKKEHTQVGSRIRAKGEKQKKGLKKGRQQKSQAKWKFEPAESRLTLKDELSKSREGKSRKRSRMKLQKMKTEISLSSTPSSLFTEEVQLLEQVGEGTFGKVFRGRLRRNRQIVAVKRVLQDNRYRNRQTQIVKVLNNDFVCEVFSTYMTRQNKNEYLNITMRYYQQNLYQRIKSYPVGKMPNLQKKIILYQLFKGLSYLHSLNICHRDIKPQNLLLKGNKAAICDFGSAKVLIPDEKNISYICARCYRAPQLIFGATQYSTQVDIWSAGCVILEIINGDPLFIGETSITHMLEIIKVLGTPLPVQVLAMNEEYDIRTYQFPHIERKEWNEVLTDTDQNLLKLLNRVMVYSPQDRATAIQVLTLDYFDEVRDQLTYSHISSMYHLHDFFSFSKEELFDNEHFIEKLVPKWYRHHKL